jgi:hypothetical protein
MDNSTKTMRGPGGIRVELDRKEWYPDDPGNGTPIMVCMDINGTEYNSTLGVATNEGVVTSTGRSFIDHNLTDSQLKWLRDNEEDFWDFINAKES